MSEKLDHRKSMKSMPRYSEARTQDDADPVAIGVGAGAKSSLMLGWVWVVSGCAISTNDGVESSLRRMQSRLVRLEARNSELQDQIVVLGAQMEEYRADITALASSTSQGLAPREATAQAGESRAPEPLAETPVELRLYGRDGSDPFDVTDRPPSADEIDPRESNRIYDDALNGFRSGEFAEAREFFEQFVAYTPRDPRIPRAYYWIGECSYELQNYRDAIASYRQLINEYPESRKAADAMFKIGASYEALLDHRGARKAFEKLVKTHPDSAYAELARARLQ